MPKKSVKSIFKNKEDNAKIARKNFILFFGLFAISLFLENILLKAYYKNLFYLFSLVFGFVSLAFLIILLIFFFLRRMK